MSEDNTQTMPNQSSSEDLEAIKQNRDQILEEKRDLKSKFDTLNSNYEKMENTLNALGSLVGVKEGEDITSKAQELIKAKEQEAFEKMTDLEKLQHEFSVLKDDLTNQKLAKEKAENEALSLRIDDTIKNGLGKRNIDSDFLESAMLLLKTQNGFTGINGSDLLMGDKSASLDSVLDSFQEANKKMFKNPAKGGSGFSNGQGSFTPNSDMNSMMKQARETRNFRGVISSMRKQQKGE